MRSVVLCAHSPSSARFFDPVEVASVEGVPIAFGNVELAEPAFDADSSRNQHAVLIKVRAFSCNFRDKPLMLSWSSDCEEGSYYFVGSEFVGEVLDVGSEVSGFARGDRVIPNNQYPYSGVQGLRPGVPTSHASRGYLRLHEAKLVKVPDAMPDEVAAGFSLGAQTAYSMLRRADVAEGSNVLVTAARSNTALFVIGALKNRGVDVYATSTSAWTEAEARELGIKELVRIDPKLDSFYENERVKDIVSSTGGFDCVVDPFFDLHVSKVVDVMSFGAGYVTCGLYDQFSSLTKDSFRYQGKDITEILVRAIVNNLQFIGNCLGQAEDLETALLDYSEDRLAVKVDSVFQGHSIGAFLDRTYNDKARLGKVIYSYSNAR